MKKNILLSAIILLFAFTISAQNDTLYIMKSGVIVGQYDVNTEIDSIIFYKPEIELGNTLVDPRDGNIYEIVTIGEQVWMAENLKYLPSVVGLATGSDTEPYYYVSGYDGTDVEEAKITDNYNTYGVLYNWTAAMDTHSSSSANPSGRKGVCPSGWHLPSDAEWTELVDYLGGKPVAGGKLKETGTTHWAAPNTGATNETGFTALPGGDYSFSGEFTDIGEFGYWWSTTEYTEGHSWYHGMRYNDSNIFSNYFFKKNGFSVRCIRD